MAGRVQTDEQLLAAWQGGDRGAAKALLDRYLELIHRFFRHKAPAERVDDLSQKTFQRCIEVASGGRKIQHFRAHLLAIARNLLVDQMRAVKREFVPLENSVVDAQTSAGGVLAREQTEFLLLDALRSIPLDHQIAIELHYWEELSGPEIAAVLGIPEGTVRSRLRHAKTALRSAMERRERDPAKILHSIQSLGQWADNVRAHGQPLGKDQG